MIPPFASTTCTHSHMNPARGREEGSTWVPETTFGMIFVNCASASFWRAKPPFERCSCRVMPVAGSYCGCCQYAVQVAPRLRVLPLIA